MNLKKIRTEKGITQKAIADKVDKTVGAISNYEVGIREPDLGTLKKLASALDVTVDELLEDETDENDENDNAG